MSVKCAANPTVVAVPAAAVAAAVLFIVVQADAVMAAAVVNSKGFSKIKYYIKEINHYGTY
jgi:hypothetical protein